MKTNVGYLDRAIRAVLGILIMGAAYYYESTWGLAGLALALSAWLGYCPVYHLLGVNTLPHPKDEIEHHIEHHA